MRLKSDLEMWGKMWWLDKVWWSSLWHPGPYCLWYCCYYYYFSHMSSNFLQNYIIIRRAKWPSSSITSVIFIFFTFFFFFIVCCPWWVNWSWNSHGSYINKIWSVGGASVGVETSITRCVYWLVGWGVPSLLSLSSHSFFFSCHS